MAEVRLEREACEQKLVKLGVAKTAEEAEALAIKVTFTKYSSILMDMLDNTVIPDKRLEEPTSTVELKLVAAEAMA
jgi:hypothetical protein